MAAESQTCCTVETPSHLILFYPESIPSPLTTLLPTLPLCKPVGHRLVLGRSSSSDIRLNDERMSRAYAALWHDGKDPFVFRVSNLSERKLLTVDGAMLRYQEEAEVRDGSVLVLDFLEFKVKVCAGDVVAFAYQVSFVKNKVMSPVSLKPPEGKCFMPSRPDDFSLTSSCLSQACKLPLNRSGGEAAGRLMTCIRSGSLDSGMGLSRAFSHPEMDYVYPSRRSSCCESVGIEYELPENVCSTPSVFFSEGREVSPWSGHSAPSSGNHAGKKLSLNITRQSSSSAEQFTAPSPPTTPEQPQLKLLNISVGSNQTAAKSSAPKQGLSCWFNISPDSPVAQTQETNPGDSSLNLPALARRVQDGLFVSKQKVCSTCRGCGEGSVGPTTPEQEPGTGRQTLTLPDMVPKLGPGRRSPMENAEWDTDDPNVNSYMG